MNENQTERMDYSEILGAEGNQEFLALRKRYWEYNNGDDSKKLNEKEFKKFQDYSDKVFNKNLKSYDAAFEK